MTIFPSPPRCDIFCTVVDNYGDIGVCWRLARQLAHEYAVTVRLWVDDLASFGKLCREFDPLRDEQSCRQVEVRRWPRDWVAVPVADWVIEAFACELPPDYVTAMAAQPHPPVWINLEYLSAESWVEGCHGLPSPHPALPLTKYFFFPGFTPRTGGLLLERDLLARRDAFRRADNGLSLPVPSAALTVSLFAYENAAVGEWLQACCDGNQPVVCLVPEGRILPQVAQFFGAASGQAGQCWQRGALQVVVLPFVEQERYDDLLWSCDVNFVRGEDSCVRAQWAAKPFVWQIYPQQDGVHLDKLAALLAHYQRDLPAAAAAAQTGLWLAWNREAGVAAAWAEFVRQLPSLRVRAQTWAAERATHNLAANLYRFAQEKTVKD